MSGPVLPPVRPAFRALARTILPETAGLDECGWRELEEVIEGSLATRPPRLRRQLRALVRLLQILPVPRYGRPFTSLSPERRAGFLAAVQHSPLLLLRRGFWGLRTLVFMGYYGRPEGAAAVGYRADPRGWEARR